MVYVFIVSTLPYVLSLFLCDFWSASAVALIIFSLTPLILPWRLLTKKSTLWNVSRSQFPKILEFASNLAILSAIINIYLCAKAGGFDLKSIDILQSLADASSLNAVKRYTENVEPSNAFLMMLTFNGLIISSIYRKTSKIAVILLCIGIYTILTLAKWPLYVGISMSAAGYLATSPSCGFIVKSDKIKKPITSKLPLLLIALFIAFVVTSAISLRISMKTFEFSDIVKNVNSYTLNQYCNFVYWYENIYEPLNLPILKSYFPGPSSLLGISRIQGIYEQSLFINDSESNIFTVNRGLIESFTLLGPFMLSALTSLAILFTRKNKMLKVLVITLNMTLISCFIGTNVSIFKDNSIWVAIVISAILIIKYPPLISKTKSES